MVKKNPDFRFNQKRKSGKTEFLKNIERALITHLITVLFATLVSAAKFEWDILISNG